MPTYTFKNNDTEVVYDEFMGMSEKDKYLADNPHISQVPVMFSYVCDHIMGVGPKVDSSFNERLQQIANSHPGSPLADRYGKSSHKEIKTRNVLKKHKVI